MSSSSIYTHTVGLTETTWNDLKRMNNGTAPPSLIREIISDYLRGRKPVEPRQNLKDGNPFNKVTLDYEGRDLVFVAV